MLSAAKPSVEFQPMRKTYDELHGNITRSK
jgi:hypothetical protein